MIRIAVEDARPGMKLARAVLNQSGIAVFAEGITLTEPVIARIESTGITTLYIAGRKVPDRSLSEELAALDRRFRNTETFPEMAALKRMVREHIEALYRTQ